MRGNHHREASETWKENVDADADDQPATRDRNSDCDREKENSVRERKKVYRVSGERKRERETGDLSLVIHLSSFPSSSLVPSSHASSSLSLPLTGDSGSPGVARREQHLSQPFLVPACILLSSSSAEKTQRKRKRNEADNQNLIQHQRSCVTRLSLPHTHTTHLSLSLFPFSPRKFTSQMKLNHTHRHSLTPAAVSQFVQW